jgi:hypothetical protein
MTIGIAICVASAAVSGITCTVEDNFNDEFIGSMWYEYQTAPAAVSLTEVGAVGEFGFPYLEASFDVLVADPDSDGSYAALLSSDPDGGMVDWSIDLTQNGAVFLDLELTYLPSYPGNELGLGIGVFDGYTPDGDLNMVLDISWGVEDDEYAIRVNQDGNDEVNLGMWTDDFIYVWWVHDGGVWLGYQLGVPLYTISSDEGELFCLECLGDPDQLSVVLFAYNVNNALAEDGLGFRSFCIMDTDVHTIPEPCQWDVRADYVIDRDDVLELITQWGTGDTHADTNGDLTVDVLDLIAVLTNWGPCLDWGPDE